MRESTIKKQDLVADLLAEDPGLALRPEELAVLVGCHRGSLYRMPAFLKVLEEQKAEALVAKASSRKGFVNRDRNHESISIDKVDPYPGPYELAAEREQWEMENSTFFSR